MKRIVVRGVFTVCSALLTVGICHAQGGGGGGGGGGGESARDRDGSKEAERWQWRREFERERRLREGEARRAADERRREHRLYNEERHREAFLKEQERAREAEQRRRELEREEFLKWQERQREDWYDSHGDEADDEADYGPRPGQGPDWDALRVNEERKLQRHLDQAEHLRRISEENGNPRLADVADRMEERALDHYERRLAHIDEGESAGRGVPWLHGDPAGPPRPPFGQAGSTPAMEPPPSRLSEFSDVYQRQLFNEEQILRQRLATAERMRQLGEYYRDPELIDEAARVEEAALTSFDQRMQDLRGPMTPVQQVQLDQYLERSIAGALEQEIDRRVLQPIHDTVIRPIDDLEHAILDQPVRHIIEDVSDWIGR